MGIARFKELCLDTARDGAEVGRFWAAATGGEYTRTSKPVPFLDAMESVWVAERLEDLKEARFRCTLSGSWARFTLTPAQGETYVELESGIDPTTLRWRLMNAMGSRFLKDWIVKVLDALPGEVAARRLARRD